MPVADDTSTRRHPISRGPGTNGPGTDGADRFMTLFVDASFCHATRAAGYGAWAKEASFVSGLMFGGRLPGHCNNACDAELNAIAAAMHRLSEQGHLAGLNSLLVQSDSVRSLQLIAGSVPGTRIANHAKAATVTKKPLVSSPSERLAIVAIGNLAGGFRLLVRHVKGHKPGVSRQWVNRQCDAMARRHMKDERARRRGQEVGT